MGLGLHADAESKDAPNKSCILTMDQMTVSCDRCSDDPRELSTFTSYPAASNVLTVSQLTVENILEQLPMLAYRLICTQTNCMLKAHLKQFEVKSEAR